MSEEDKVLKRQKIEQNRAKKRPLGNAKLSKSKKSCTEECNYDDVSVSVNSVASTVSDTYFWESERKYTDLDANRQSVTESMSPVTAASVPSPSSPPENGIITGSKTLDMMKDSSHNSNSSFESYDHSPINDEDKNNVKRLKINISSLMQSHDSLDKVKSMSHSLGKDKKSVTSSKRIERNVLDLNAEFGSDNNELLKYSSECDSMSNYDKFHHSPVQSSTYYEHLSHPKKLNFDTNAGLYTNAQTCPEESVMCQKPHKETCPKKDNLSVKLMKDPNLVTKLINNTNFVSKIFQNQDILLKIMTDSAIITKLEEDPQISEILRENGAIIERETKFVNDTNIESRDDLKPTSISSHTYKQTCKQKHIENPILTDLITNSNTEESTKQHIEPSSSSNSDWNKNVTDVTKDVLQDVQR